METPVVDSINFGPSKLAQGGVIERPPSLIVMGDDSTEMVIPRGILSTTGGVVEPKIKAKSKLNEITIKLSLDTTEFMESLAKTKAELLEVLALKQKVGLSVSPELPQTEEEMFEFLKEFTEKLGGIR